MGTPQVSLSLDRADECVRPYTGGVNGFGWKSGSMILSVTMEVA